jgi:enoyl-CoA hydratase
VGESSQMPSVVLEFAGNGITLLRIQRPEKLNALDRRTIEALSAAFTQIADDDSVRVVILSGAGTAFCAGGDLPEVLEIGADPQWEPRMQQMMASAAALVLQMRRLPQPIIAAINGPAVGGGMGLAMAADIRLCSTSAYFSTAFIALGLVGFEMGLSVLLPGAIGASAAFELAVTGGRLSAQQAERLNLVREVIEPEELPSRALQLAETIASRSPAAVRATKEMMNNHLSLAHLQQTLQTETAAQMQRIFSEENRAAIEKIARKSPR